MSRPTMRHNWKELTLFLALIVLGGVAGLAIEQYGQNRIGNRFWDEAERRGHAHKVYDGPFDQTPTRTWKDAEAPR